MQKSQIYLIGTIFGFLSSLGFIMFMGSSFGIIMSFYNNHGLSHSSLMAGGTAGVLGLILLLVGGIGAFVSGIIQIVKAEYHPEKTLAILSGVFNIIWSAILVGPILSLIAHIKQK